MDELDSAQMRLAVYAFIEDADSLLVTQLADTEPDAGSWTLPGGGVDFGEHPIDALHRELYEETGLKGSVQDLLVINSHVFPRHESRGLPALHAVRLIYRMSASGSPRVVEEGGTTSAVAWHPLKEIEYLSRVDLVDIGMEHAAGA